MDAFACLDCNGLGHTFRKSAKARVTVPVEVKCDVCGGVGVRIGPCPPRSPPVCLGTDYDVAIVGCGIGGAALALALQQRSISFVALERDTTFSQRRQGYGLTMQQGAIALSRLGIAVAGTSSLGHVSFLPDGAVIGCYGREAYNRPSNKKEDTSKSTLQASHKLRHNIQIPRQRLRAMLVRRLDPRHVTWGARCERIVEEEGSSFASLFLVGCPQPIRASVVVGADGIFSAVRAHARGGVVDPLCYLGVIVVLGIANASHLPTLHRRVTQTLDGETRIFTMPFTSATDPKDEAGEEEEERGNRFKAQTDVVMWQLSFRCDVSVAVELGRRGGEALKEEALRRCGEWHSPLPELLMATEADDITGYPAYDREWVASVAASPTSRVTILGDAAHCMSPFKGQGANQALIDAVKLAQELACVLGPTRSMPLTAVPEILRRFEEGMAARGGEKVQSSRVAAAFLHSQEALAVGNCVRSAESLGEGGDTQSKRRAVVHDEQHEETRRLTVQKMFEGR